MMMSNHDVIILIIILMSAWMFLSNTREFNPLLYFLNTFILGTKHYGNFISKQCFLLNLFLLKYTLPQKEKKGVYGLVAQDRILYFVSIGFLLPGGQGQRLKVKVNFQGIRLLRKNTHFCNMTALPILVDLDLWPWPLLQV